MLPSPPHGTGELPSHLSQAPHPCPLSLQPWHQLERGEGQPESRGWGPFKPLPSQVSGPLPTGTTPPALSCQGLRAHPRSVLSSSREYHVQGERSHREGLALTFPLGPPPGQMPWMLTRTGGRRQESVCWAHADTTRTVSCSTHQPPGSTGTPSACISDHVVFFRTRYFCIKRKG